MEMDGEMSEVGHIFCDVRTEPNKVIIIQEFAIIMIRWSIYLSLGCCLLRDIGYFSKLKWRYLSDLKDFASSEIMIRNSRLVILLQLFY